MKKFIFYIYFYLGLSNIILAQAPQGFNYQGLARDIAGNSIKNQAISLRFSILSNSTFGSPEFIETQNLVTNSNGGFGTIIGSGTPVLGVFNTINWGNGLKFLKVELDAKGGTAFIHVGTSQLLSVPFALYAEKGGTPGPKGDTGAIGAKGDKGDKGDVGGYVAGNRIDISNNTISVKDSLPPKIVFDVANIDIFSLTLSSELPLKFKDEILDESNVYNPTTGEFIAPSNGIYHFDVSALAFSPIALGGFGAKLVMKKNGVGLKEVEAGGQNEDSVTMYLSVNVKLQKNDKIVIFGRNFSSSNNDVRFFQTSTNFSGYLVY